MSLAAALLRTSRAALRPQRGLNPVQNVLGKRYVDACRTYATAFERTKPHVNIGTIPVLPSDTVIN